MSFNHLKEKIESIIKFEVFAGYDGLLDSDSVEDAAKEIVSLFNDIGTFEAATTNDLPKMLKNAKGE